MSDTITRPAPAPRPAIRALTETVRVAPLGDINFMSGDDDRAADNYERLSAVKAVYDPDSVFHVNQNIAPTGR